MKMEIRLQLYIVQNGNQTTTYKVRCSVFKILFEDENGNL